MSDDADQSLRIVLTVHHEVRRTGGASGATMALADELERRGHVVEVVGMGVLGPSRGGTIDALRFPHVIGELLRRRLDQGDCDVVDASSGDLAYVGERRVRASSTAVFTRSHGLEHLAVARRRGGARDGELNLRWRYSAYHAGLRLWEVERSFRAADGALLLNHAELAYGAEELQLPAERVWLTSPVLRDLQLEPPAPQRDVLVLGPASWRKGGDVSVRVLDQLLRSSPEATASWHGLDNPIALAASLGADVRSRVALGGPYDENQLMRLLATHRIVLFPSRFEGLPVTLLEALGAGLAAVGSDVPGVRELLGDGAGVLVPDGHVEGFEAAIRRLLGSDAARAACGAQGKVVAARHAPALVVDDLEAAYRTVLSVKRPHR